MERTEFEAVAFLVLLEDVAAQAPSSFDEGTRMNAGEEGDTPSSQVSDSLTRQANAGIHSPSGTGESFTAIAPSDANTAPGKHPQPALTMGHGGHFELGDEAQQGPIHESPLRLSGEIGQFKENPALSEDDCPSRARPETADQMVSATPDWPDVMLDGILEGAETDAEGPGELTLRAASSGRPHLPQSNLSSLDALALAHDAEHPRTAVESLKTVPPEGQVWPTHQASAKTKETSRGNLLRLASGDPITASFDALVAAPVSTRMGSRAAKRSVLRRQEMNRELARRIAWLEEQLELKPEIARLQDSESQPRLCYPV